MFKSLKEKLGNWIKKSKEKIEKTQPEPEKAKSREETSEKPLGVLDKADKLIKETKEKKLPETPLEYDTATHKYKPDLEKIKKDDKIEDPAKILAKKPAKEVAEVLEEKSDETAQEVSEKVKEIKAEEIEEKISKEEPEEKTESILSKIKSKITYKISEEEFNEIFEDLEMLLLENNVALEIVEDIEKELKKELIGKEISKKDLESEIKEKLKDVLNKIIIEPDNPLESIKLKSNKPFIILFFGINGTGKTTSIAKFANLLKKNNFSVVLAAGDTFRAASIEQISEHSKKLKVPLIKHDYGSDPSAVGFDAIKYAEKNKIDVVLIDTAGRMHTKTNLLNEMEKICRVTNPDLKIFVAESIAGNDATEQAKTFNKLIEIDGSILSKADIDEKGGTIISVSHATNKPIFYLGTGQNYNDLELFDKNKFIDSLGL